MVTNKVNIRWYEVSTDVGQSFRRNYRDIHLNRGRNEPSLQPLDVEFDLPDTNLTEPSIETRPTNEAIKSDVYLM